MATLTIPGLQHLREDRRRFGLAKAVAGFVYRVAQRLVNLRVNYLMSRPMAGIDALVVGTGLEGLDFRPLTPDEVRALAADPANDLDVAMADRLAAGHDWCFAALRGNRLVNYSWYALGSIERHHSQGVGISFPADTVYLYKAYTHPEFRGAGVHQAAFVCASRWLARLGLLQIVLIVEFANWPSLRSHQRLGFRNLGPIIAAGRGACQFELDPRAGRRIGVRFGALADSSGRLVARAEPSRFAELRANGSAHAMGSDHAGNLDPCVAGLLPPGFGRCEHGFHETTR